MLFNIQEPIAFGLPIVLNPMLLVPYILAPIANTIIGWLAISAGLVSIFKYVVPWTMPVFFGGLIGTGTISGGLLQLVCLAVDVVIYAPFVIAALLVPWLAGPATWAAARRTARRRGALAAHLGRYAQLLAEHRHRAARRGGSPFWGFRDRKR